MVKARHREGFDEESLFGEDLWDWNKADCQHNVDCMQSRKSGDLPLQ